MPEKQAILPRLATVTVSYTHLDVYKRQVDMNGLRDLGDQLKGKLGEGVVLLAAVKIGRAHV